MQSVTEARQVVQGGSQAAVTKPQEPCPGTQGASTHRLYPQLQITRPMGGGEFGLFKAVLTLAQQLPSPESHCAKLHGCH